LNKWRLRLRELTANLFISIFAGYPQGSLELIGAKVLDSGSFSSNTGRSSGQPVSPAPIAPGLSPNRK